MFLKYFGSAAILCVAIYISLTGIKTFSGQVGDKKDRNPGHASERICYQLKINEKWYRVEPELYFETKVGDKVEKLPLTMWAYVNENRIPFKMTLWNLGAWTSFIFAGTMYLFLSNRKKR